MDLDLNVIFLGDQEVQIRAFHRSVDDYMKGNSNA